MAKIAIVSVGVAGRVFASCEIARRLAARGHQVVLACLDPNVGKHLAGGVLRFHQLSDDVPQELRNAISQTGRGAERWRLRREATRTRGASALCGHGIDAFLEAETPQLLLVESELHNTILYLYSRSIPIVLLEYHLSVVRQPSVPPLDSHVLPVGHFVALRSAMAWRLTLLRRRLRQMEERWRLGPWDARSVWQRLARCSGVDLRDITVEDQWPMLAYPDLPCLQLSAIELDFPAATARRCQCVGPMIQRERPVSPDARPDAQTCRHWLEGRDRTRPLVLCTTGSILTLPEFIRKVIAAGKGADFDLLIAAGRHAPAKILGQPWPNVQVVRSVPQLEVLAQASLFICHGGIASIHEALFAGVPLLVYSGGCLDENGNAARVEYHGLGKRGRVTRDGVNMIRSKIESLLASEKVLVRVRAMGERLQRYEREQCLEQYVESHLDTEPVRC